MFVFFENLNCLAWLANRYIAVHLFCVLVCKVFRRKLVGSSEELFVIWIIKDKTEKWPGVLGGRVVLVADTDHFILSRLPLWFAPDFEKAQKGWFLALPVIKVVSYVPKVGGSFLAHRLPPPVKLTAMIWLKYCWMWR